ncbi:YncE family protein [Gaopeijia maritima]|uniref:YncE family protein n=1 Tax=Gaopeijia maritima TaxID=3119007 RepID=UPI0032846264
MPVSIARTPMALLLAAALTGLAPAGGSAQIDGLDGTVIVLNKQGDDASFIDLASGAIVATVPTGPSPHELVTTSDGRLAVGTDYGGQTLTVFDVERAAVVRTIDLGRFTRPHGIVVLPGDSLVAVTSETRGAVLVVRIADGELVEVLETEAAGSHMVAATADGTTLWTGDMGSHTVTELRRGTAAPVRALSAPQRPEAVNVSPDGARVFAGSNDTGRITAWSTATGEPTTVAEGFGWPYRVFLTPGVEQIIVPDMDNEVVRFFDGADYRELGSLDFSGEGPQGLVLHRDGRHLFLSLSRADRIAVIDIATRAVVGTLPTGRSPDGIAWSPRAVTR